MIAILYNRYDQFMTNITTKFVVATSVVIAVGILALNVLVK